MVTSSLSITADEPGKSRENQETHYVPPRAIGGEMRGIRAPDACTRINVSVSVCIAHVLTLVCRKKPSF